MNFSLSLIFLLGQIFNPHGISTLPESEKAAIRDAAGTYSRTIDGKEISILPLVSWDMNPIGRPRPSSLTNWTRLIGRATPQGSNFVVYQDPGRIPSVLVLSNLPPGWVKANRVNAYAMSRGRATISGQTGMPRLVPLYDFGKLVYPPGSTNSFTNTIRVYRQGGRVRGEYVPSPR